MSRRRALVVQVAAMVAVAGVLFILAGLVPRTAQPAPVQPLRPATEQERRNWETERLEQLLREQQRAASTSPSPSPVR